MAWQVRNREWARGSDAAAGACRRSCRRRRRHPRGCQRSRIPGSRSPIPGPRSPCRSPIRPVLCHPTGSTTRWNGCAKRFPLLARRAPRNRPR